MIPAFTIEQAEKLLCPFEIREYCVSCLCMAWHMSERRIEREDHSDANMFMIKQQDYRAAGSEIKRRGPPGCTGILYLEERGYCRRLWIGSDDAKIKTSGWTRGQ